MEDLLTFLAERQTIVLGAAATVAELVVIVVNMFRKINKIRNSKKELASQMRVNQMAADAPGKCYSVDVDTSLTKKEYAKALAWSANPLNLFK